MDRSCRANALRLSSVTGVVPWFTAAEQECKPGVLGAARSHGAIVQHIAVSGPQRE